MIVAWATRTTRCFSRQASAALRGFEGVAPAVWVLVAYGTIRKWASMSLRKPPAYSSPAYPLWTTVQMRCSAATAAWAATESP
eukprot:scaffold1282_cov251-Pinguiococcus_pyrenoidosus.AAC.38